MEEGVLISHLSQQFAACNFACQLKAGLWIDLTNTSRFYDEKAVEAQGCNYLKLQCRGSVCHEYIVEELKLSPVRVLEVVLIDIYQPITWCRSKWTSIVLIRQLRCIVLKIKYIRFCRIIIYTTFSYYIFLFYFVEVTCPNVRTH